MTVAEFRRHQAVTKARARSAPGKMNKTEAAYAGILLSDSTVEMYWFESLKFRLGHNTHYTPDFFVIRTGGVVEIVEVKGGYVREDAMVKFKAAAERYPCFRWTMMQKKKGEWNTLLAL